MLKSLYNGNLSANQGIKNRKTKLGQDIKLPLIRRSQQEVSMMRPKGLLLVCYSAVELWQQLAAIKHLLQDIFKVIEVKAQSQAICMLYCLMLVVLKNHIPPATAQFSRNNVSKKPNTQPSLFSSLVPTLTGDNDHLSAHFLATATLQQSLFSDHFQSVTVSFTFVIFYPYVLPRTSYFLLKIMNRSNFENFLAL